MASASLPSSACSAPSPLCLDVLPADILVVILRLLPVVPRIRTIARLNKRWRELAYRSVDSFTNTSIDWARSTCVNALARLPSLTSLDISGTTTSRPLRLPTTLRHLGVSLCPSLQLSEPLPAHLTSFSLSQPSTVPHSRRSRSASGPKYFPSIADTPRSSLS